MIRLVGIQSNEYQALLPLVSRSVSLGNNEAAGECGQSIHTGVRARRARGESLTTQSDWARARGYRKEVDWVSRIGREEHIS